MIEAELHDGRVLEFPDGTDPAVVHATVKKMLNPPEESKLQKGFLTVADAAVKASPLGVINTAGELVDHAAYKAGEFTSDTATKLGASPEVAAGYGIGTNLAIQAPFMLAGGEVAKLASPAMRSAATNLMSSALKPTIAELRTGNAAKAIQTMLEEGVNVTQGGLAKLRAKIDDLNQQIKEAIKSSPATVDKNKVAGNLLGTLKKFENQVTPQSDMKAISAAWDEFMANPMLKGDAIPVQTAQAMKQGTYRVLEGKYGEVGSAATEAQKDLARGLKEGVAAAVPEVAGLNAAESKLINALNVAERRVLLSANKNPAGLAWMAKNPAAAAGFLADRSELFKSLAARMINHNAETIPATAGRVVGAGAGAYTGRTE